MSQKPSVYCFMSRKRRFCRSVRGFTVVELLVTISIITLLLGIGTTVALKMAQEARKEQMRSMMESLLGANVEFKAVRKQSNINHDGSYPVNWAANADSPGLSSSERYVIACRQIKAAEEIMLAALNSSSSTSFKRLYKDDDNDGYDSIFDWWGTEVEYRSKNGGAGGGTVTGVLNSDLPISNSPFFASAGPDQVWGTDDDVNTVQK